MKNFDLLRPKLAHLSFADIAAMEQFNKNIFDNIAKEDSKDYYRKIGEILNIEMSVRLHNLVSDLEK